MIYCKTCGELIDETVQQFCPNCGTPVEKPAAPVNSANTMPMKWYKWLIYLILFLSALSNAVSAITVFTGSHYGSQENTAMVYAFFKNLKTIDMLYAIVLIVLAVIAIMTRMKLAGYKADGPKFLLILYAGSLISSVAYLVLVSSVCQLPLEQFIDSSTITSIVTQLAMIFINKTYFDKRSHLFTN